MLSLFSARIWAKIVLESVRKDYSLDNITHSYVELGIDSYLHSPQELNFPRNLVHHLSAARTGHGDLVTYHDRFKLADATVKYNCFSLKSSYHTL